MRSGQSIGIAALILAIGALWWLALASPIRITSTSGLEGYIYRDGHAAASLEGRLDDMLPGALADVICRNPSKDHYVCDAYIGGAQTNAGHASYRIAIDKYGGWTATKTLGAPGWPAQVTDLSIPS